MMMTKRIGGWAIAALLVSSAVASAQTVVTGPEDLPRSLSAGAAGLTERSSNTAIALLRRPVESVNWDETPLEDVLDWLNDMGEGRVNIVTRWSQLAVESVDRDSPVTLRLGNTTVAEVLNEVLDQLSEDGEIRYHGIDNQLRISTRADFDRKMYRRVYDVTDIMFRVPNLGRSAPIIDLQQTTSGAGGGGGGGGQSIFSGSSQGSEQEEAGEQAEQNLLQRLTDLRQLIEQTIAPETWATEQQGAAAAATAAGRGRIRIFNRSLVVYNTIEVHEMIAGWFELGE